MPERSSALAPALLCVLLSACSGDKAKPGTSTKQRVVHPDDNAIPGPVGEQSARDGKPHTPTNEPGAGEAGAKDWLWPGGVIPYEFDGVSAEMIEVVKRAFGYFQCAGLGFRPRTPGDEDYVRFLPSTGCASYVGRTGGAQEVFLDSSCSVGRVAHELMHAAGFNHEQSRPDRDGHVTIDFSQIKPGMMSDFDKRADPRGEMIGPYDYESIMHYEATAFSDSGRPTIIPKVAGVTIGQRDRLSALDCAALVSLYGPPKNPTNPTRTAQPAQPPKPTPPTPLE